MGQKLRLFVNAACDKEPAGKIKMPVCQGKIQDHVLKNMRDSGCGGVVVKKKQNSSLENTR